MTCKQAMALMQAFSDGEVDAYTRRRMLAHLSRCDTCRRQYQDRRRLTGGIVAALSAEAGAPPTLTAAVSSAVAARPLLRRTLLHRTRRLITMRSSKIAFSAAGLIVVALVAGWIMFGQDIALARAIDGAMRGVTSAHFTAYEGNREIEVWATHDAERVNSPDGWMIATGGRAYLFDLGAKRVTVSDGAIAHLQMLRGLNVLLLSERLRGRALGKPTVEKETITLPSGQKAIRISARAKARHYGVVCRFEGTMLVNPATNLIMSGEASETVPDTKAAQRLVHRGKLRSTHVRVDWIDYNAQVPSGLFDTTIPPGWEVVHKDR